MISGAGAASRIKNPQGTFIMWSRSHNMREYCFDGSSSHCSSSDSSISDLYDLHGKDLKKICFFECFLFTFATLSAVQGYVRIGAIATRAQSHRSLEPKKLEPSELIVEVIL
jgi:hypothetical protein